MIHASSSTIGLMKERVSMTIPTLVGAVVVRTIAPSQRAIEEAQRPAFATLDDIEAEFDAAAALDGVTWRAMWPVRGSEYRLVDLNGRVRPWARPYRVAARRGYVRGRRSFLKEERRRAQFAGDPGAARSRVIEILDITKTSGRYEAGYRPKTRPGTARRSRLLDSRDLPIRPEPERRR